MKRNRERELDARQVECGDCGCGIHDLDTGDNLRASTDVDAHCRKQMAQA
jgi:transcription initiation factor TFIIIB Brf1 subunit/transcription initiation factor TFIIB